LLLAECECNKNNASNTSRATTITTIVIVDRAARRAGTGARYFASVVAVPQR
jgi:hypothetical protein